MQGFNKIITKEQMQEALSRNKRFGNKAFKSLEVKQKNEFSEFLKWYVFKKLNISPQALLGHIQTQYYAEQNIRDRRQRNVDFIRGRQFNEVVWDDNRKKYCTQLEYLRVRNIPPLTYNVISKFVRSLTGQFYGVNTGNVVKCESKDDRGQELANILTTCVNRVLRMNESESKDAANFQEMLASGRPIYKLRWDSRDGIEPVDVRFRIVTMPLFTTNPGIVDYDLDNLHRATEIHDTDLGSIVMQFANGDYERGQQIESEYIRYQGSELQKSSYSYQSFDGSQLRNMTFTSMNNSSYRYIEHWVQIVDFEAVTLDPLDGTGMPTAWKWGDIEKIKKAVDEENQARLEKSEGQLPEEEIFIQFDAKPVKRWYVIFLTPWGSVLDVKESPYKDGIFPYVMTPPGINGEVWGLVEELINPQLSMDRQILNADAIVANASKGTWLIPDTAVPDGWSNKEYISELKKVDGAVIYKVRDGVEKILPEQVYSNSANVSANVQQLIQLYSGLVDEISGNYGAAQGRDTGQKTASGYAQETANAGLNVRSVMETYSNMLSKRDNLILKLILQGYSKTDFERITGESIDPMELKRYTFIIEASKGTNSPAYKLQLEEELLRLVEGQLIPLEVFMEVSNNPVMVQAKQKLDEWRKKQAQIQQQQQMIMQQPGMSGSTAPQTQTAQQVQQPVTA